MSPWPPAFGDSADRSPPTAEVAKPPSARDAVVPQSAPFRNRPARSRAIVLGHGSDVPPQRAVSTSQTAVHWAEVPIVDAAPHDEGPRPGDRPPSFPPAEANLWPALHAPDDLPPWHDDWTTALLDRDHLARLDAEQRGVLSWSA